MTEGGDQTQGIILGGEDGPELLSTATALHSFTRSWKSFTWISDVFQNVQKYH